MKVRRPSSRSSWCGGAGTARNARVLPSSSSSFHLPSVVLGAALCLPFLLFQVYTDRHGGGFATRSAFGAAGHGSGSVPDRHTIPMVPLQHCIQYTRRNDIHEFATETQTVRLPGIGPSASYSTVVDMSAVAPAFPFLVKSPDPNIPVFQDYLVGMKGAVTHLWLAISKAILDDKKANDEAEYDTIVIDGGMHTGFYTLLTATMKLPVHSFEIQRDCFDIFQPVSQSNPKESRRYVHLYNIGLSNHTTLVHVGEGCHPNYHLNVNEFDKDGNPLRKTSLHLTPVASLDLFLQELETSLSYFTDDDDNDNEHQSQDAEEKYDPWTKEVAILKLDVGGDGTELEALNGLHTNLFKVHNIIVDYTVGSKQMLETFRRLERDGFDSYMLYTTSVTQDKFKDAAYLSDTGLASVDVHPILGTSFQHVNDFRMLWKIVDWDKTRKTACATTCHIWFHRTQPSPNM